ncbi:hypothetical protein AB1Y20_003064 [Prymnesium parvum]|uniref:Uncharacterized protein n=1 Tax=Prymnesium parvum TaxID=97485 RepID=A0AB34JAV5_PRYPA
MARRWRWDQYEASACHGLGTAGGVCPAVLLPCKLSSLPWDAASAEQHECLVQSLRGFGFNGVITPPPPSWLRSLRQSYPELHYVGVDRFEPNNKPVICKNLRTLRLRREVSRAHHSSSELLLLDSQLRVLDREYISGGDCVLGRWRVNDARLAPTNRTLWLNYLNAWGTSPPGAPCKGYWMARLHAYVAARPSDGHAGAGSAAHAPAHLASGRPGLHAVLHATQLAGGVGVDGTGGLHAERNGGLVVSPSGDRIDFELADVAPITKVHAADGRQLFHPVPASFGAAVHHNSINPLWVPELRAYLGVSHRHYLDGTSSSTGRFDPSAPFQYGYAYRHVFFTIEPPLMKIVRHSREFCFPSLEALEGNISADGSELCDGIQFMMGAFRQHPTSRTISFTYGVQDCETAILTLSIRRISKLLAFPLTSSA